MLKKDVPYVWTKKCTEAYSYLKRALTSEPILMFPDFQKQFTLSTDASSNGLAYILEQKDRNGIRKPVCYGGRTLKGAEKNYSAIVTARGGRAGVQHTVVNIGEVTGGSLVRPGQYV